MTMTPEDMKKREEMVNSMCICRGCPTYTVLGKEDDYMGYCFPGRGRSKNIKDEQGCICGTCPIYGMFRYLTQYYCTRGTEQEQKAAIAKEVQTGQSAYDSLVGRR